MHEHPSERRHGLAEMSRFRALLIAAGCPDANDCDALRFDPTFKMAVGRLPETGAELCSQPTMCRLENLPTKTTLSRMMARLAGLLAGFASQIGSTGCTAASNCPCSMPAPTAAASCRCISTRR